MKLQRSKQTEIKRQALQTASRNKNIIKRTTLPMNFTEKINVSEREYLNPNEQEFFHYAIPRIGLKERSQIKEINFLQ